MTRCPNCGNDYLCTLQVWSARDNVQKRCKRCGWVQFIGGVESVPECSLPPEYKTLPDEPGDWWEWTTGGWRLRTIKDIDGEWCYAVPHAAGRYHCCFRGQWTRVVPPPPPPAPKSPADRLRQIAVNAEIGKLRLHVDELLEIADELERA